MPLRRIAFGRGGVVYGGFSLWTKMEVAGDCRLFFAVGKSAVFLAIIFQKEIFGTIRSVSRNYMQLFG